MTDKVYLDQAVEIAKEATRGAVLVDKNGYALARSNRNGLHSYLNCLKAHAFPKGGTLYLTHGVNVRHGMAIIEAGIKRVVFLEELEIGVGSAMLRSMDVEVVQYVK